jgi:hypothetical protein
MILRAAWLLSLSVLSTSTISQAASNPLTQALREYDQRVAQLRSQLSYKGVQPQPSDISWVQKKLAVLVEVDQYTRKFLLPPPQGSAAFARLNEAEKKEFFQEFGSRFQSMDQEHTRELKELMKTHPWFKISVFGEQAESNAWLLVQHADHDWEFQGVVLKVLEKLLPQKETSPRNYAYLWDRVAVAGGDPKRTRPQRYGTQGKCLGPGRWEPAPIEEPEKLDERRAKMGLQPMTEYRAQVVAMCI